MRATWQRVKRCLKRTHQDTEPHTKSESGGERNNQRKRRPTRRHGSTQESLSRTPRAEARSIERAYTPLAKEPRAPNLRRNGLARV